MPENDEFKFEISLSVLNHLGRNLYRNFITVLGEAISNSWDADANNVWINIDRENNNFIIKDDGVGMSAEDFQKKFLKVGYSKRNKGQIMQSPAGRPFIGAKGIGKLALLSCADTISITSKTSSTEYISGAIDNSGLDQAIEHDMTPDEYPLENVDFEIFSTHTEEHHHGTIIHFKNTKENIRNTIPYLKKLVALYFRFSLIDENFNIYINDELVTLDDISDLSQSTEFVWNINSIEDPFLNTLVNLGSDPIQVTDDLEISGFIATVIKPAKLKISGTDERVGIDLFVNGRLREKDLLKHIPSARIPESYMYGQIHFDELDSDGEDRFTSSREGVIESDEKYQSLLERLKTTLIPKIMNEWDELRLSRDEEGDEENPRKTKKERKARDLYNISAQDYKAEENEKTNRWIKELSPDAEFNIPSYVDCYLSENLVRKYINEQQIPLTNPAQTEVDQWKQREQDRKAEANISFDIRIDNDDLNYLGMDFLAKVIEGNGNQQNTNSLVRDATEYKPMRNAVGHTSLLTEQAKDRLRLVYENIKGRVKTLLSN